MPGVPAELGPSRERAARQRDLVAPVVSAEPAVTGGGRPENDAGTCLRAARGALTAAELAETPAERYLHAQLAALRVAAVILAARARVRSRGGPRDVWRVVSDVAPEFAEWAGYFAATRGKREAVAAGAVALVSHREADDLLRDAQTFHDEVVRRLRRLREAAREAG